MFIDNFFFDFTCEFLDHSYNFPSFSRTYSQDYTCKYATLIYIHLRTNRIYLPHLA